MVNLPNSKGSVSIVFPSSNRFLKFLFRKTNKKKQTSVFGPQRLPAFTKHVLPVHDTIFICYLFIFIFFFGGGGIKITLLSNSISVHKTDKNKSIKPKSNCSKRNHKQIKHSKYTISCYIMPSLYIILSLKWPL